MQYLVSVIFDSTTLASDDEDAAIDVFNEKLVAGGHWVFAGGLGAPAVIDNRGDEVIVTDGPYVESKEFVVGLWIIEASDHDEAVALATEGSKACNRKVEVRAFLTA